MPFPQNGRLKVFRDQMEGLPDFLGRGSRFFAFSIAKIRARAIVVIDFIARV